MYLEDKLTLTEKAIRTNHRYMLRNQKSTKIVINTMEITHLPKSIDPAGIITTGNGGSGIVQGTIFEEGYGKGLDIHLVLPEYTKIFRKNSKLSEKDFNDEYRKLLMHPNIHPIHDGLFEKAEKVYDDDSSYLSMINVRRAYNMTKGIISAAKELDLYYPDSYKLFQFNDWQTALGPAALRSNYCNIVTELKWHGPHTVVRPLYKLNEHGLNTKDFHKDLFYPNGFPSEDHVTNMYYRDVDFLASGFLRADQIDGVGYHILEDALSWRLKDIGAMSEALNGMLVYRHHQHFDEVGTVANEPSRNANPEVDPLLEHKYGTSDIMEGKAINKIKFQKEMGLEINPDAPIVYWPHRLTDPQKGTRLFLDTIDSLMTRFGNDNLQIAFVADGEYIFTRWIEGLQQKYAGRVAIRPFNNALSVLGKAAATTIMEPSLFEPRGYPQLEGPRYGTPAIVSRYVDGVISYDKNPEYGNGWVFENFDQGGIHWSVGEAVQFSKLPYEIKKRRLQWGREYNLKKHNVDKMIDSQVESWEKTLARRNQKLILRAV